MAFVAVSECYSDDGKSLRHVVTSKPRTLEFAIIQATVYAIQRVAHNVPGVEFLFDTSTGALHDRETGARLG